jgi:replicative superfamily II helicase
MTTEILRNALYGSGFDNLGYIVLDECHYMGDEGRGTVWEEIIVSRAEDVALVGLSATVANVKEIADWISLGPPADRGRSPSRAARCRCTTRSPISPARSTRWTTCVAAAPA